MQCVALRFIHVILSPNAGGTALVTLAAEEPTHCHALSALPVTGPFAQAMVRETTASATPTRVGSHIPLSNGNGIRFLNPDDVWEAHIFLKWPLLGGSQPCVRLCVRIRA